MCKKARTSWELLKNEDEVSNYKKYLLKTKDGRIIISHDNVLRVNAMIASNSSYRRSANSDECPILKAKGNIFDIMDKGDYYYITGAVIDIVENDNKSFDYIGSSAFWFSHLKKFIYEPVLMKTGVEVEYEQAGKKNSQTVSLGYVTYKTVCCVDNENSTHLNSDRMGRAWVAKKLYNIINKGIIEQLEKPDYSIINELSENKTNYFFNGSKVKIGVKGTNNIKSPKNNQPSYYVSFASKWCHNACYYMFNDENNKQFRDNFAKVDSVMKDALLGYEDELKAKNSTLRFDILKDNKNGKANEKIGQNYGEYIDIIDAVRKSGKDEISRNGLDHLLWYSNKGFDNDDD